MKPSLSLSNQRTQVTRTLLNISDDMKALDDLLAESEGDVSSASVAAALDQWENELETDFVGKVDSYARLIAEIDARVAARTNEAQRLIKRAKTDEAAADSLRERLKSVWVFRGLATVETPNYRIGLQYNGGKQPLLLEAGRLAAEWLKTTTLIEPDKDRIRAELDAGNEVEGATLGERGRRLNIR